MIDIDIFDRLIDDLRAQANAFIPDNAGLQEVRATFDDGSTVLALAKMHPRYDPDSAGGSDEGYITPVTGVPGPVDTEDALFALIEQVAYYWRYLNKDGNGFRFFATHYLKFVDAAEDLVDAADDAERERYNHLFD